MLPPERDRMIRTFGCCRLRSLVTRPAAPLWVSLGTSLTGAGRNSFGLDCFQVFFRRVEKPALRVDPAQLIQRRIDPEDSRLSRIALSKHGKQTDNLIAPRARPSLAERLKAPVPLFGSGNARSPHDFRSQGRLAAHAVLSARRRRSSRWRRLCAP